MSEPHLLVIRTSDRSTFKRCRRKWAWQSHLKGNLEPISKAAPLWLGTGFHFALEQVHGLRGFKKGSDAFHAYYEASRQAYNIDDLPADIDDLTQLACDMLDYYQDYWLVARDSLQTYVYNGKPQVEVEFQIPLPIDPPKGYDGVVHGGTFDRIAIDEDGYLWIVEYKTAKQFATGHFMIDGQCNTYSWAAYTVYDKPVQGMIYQQHRKDVPVYPRRLASGKISSDMKQKTSHRLYRKALIDLYKEVSRAPKINVDMLNWLAMQETEDRDPFIRRDKVYRNLHQIHAEGEKIIMEANEIVNPSIALYPSPARDCVYQCPFMSACVSVDDGSDWEYELKLTCNRRETEAYDCSWRNYIQWPISEEIKDGNTSNTST